MEKRNPFEPPQAPVADPQRSAESVQALTERPQTVDLAFLLIIGSAGLGLLSFLVRGMKESPLAVFVVLLILCAFAAFIRAGQNWARIVYAVFFVIGLVSFLFVPELLTRRGAVFFVIFCLQTALQGYGLWLVFRQPGSRWFKRAR